MISSVKPGSQPEKSRHLSSTIIQTSSSVKLVDKADWAEEERKKVGGQKTATSANVSEFDEIRSD